MFENDQSGNSLVCEEFEKLATFLSVKWNSLKWESKTAVSNNFRQGELKMGSHFIENVPVL